MKVAAVFDSDIERAGFPPVAAGESREDEREDTTRCRIQATTGPETIRVIRDAINARRLPDTYVADGRPVLVERVSGATSQASASDEDSALPVTSTVLDPDSLAAALADHTFTYRMRATTRGKVTEEEVTPGRNVLAPVLARREWKGLPPLRGIVGAPVLRRDGTLLQDTGYDEATGLYLSPKVRLRRVPDAPTRAQVNAARSLILGRFLPDFPWRTPADRANYLGYLVTPILRHLTRCLAPFGAIDATMPGSGKTILTAGLGMLYGQRVLSWPSTDEELRKTITAVMAQPVGTVIFDNIREGSPIKSPVLARLITERTWADRKLSVSATVAYPNDRVWLATGNNLRVGGDMATRTVMVRLDPNMPHPEARAASGFKIPNLDQWILLPANQERILWNLLVLVVDWCRADMPRAKVTPMRQFTSWAETVGGFLGHHGIESFLANAADVRDADDEDQEWSSFLGQWRRIFKDRMVTAAELRASADAEYPGGESLDWAGAFLTDENGRVPTAKGLGRYLAGQVGRWHGRYVLRAEKDTHRNARVYWVEAHDAHV